MRELIESIRERNFRSIFFKNMLKTFPALFLPLLILSAVIILLVGRRQVEDLAAGANTEIARIASRTDTMIGALSDQSMTLCYDDSVTAFSRYAFEPLNVKKLNSLVRLQNRLSTAGSGTFPIQSAGVLYCGPKGFFVSPDTAVTVAMDEPGGNYYQYRLMAAEAGTAPTAQKSGDTITVFSSAPMPFGKVVSLFSISTRNLTRQLFLELSDRNAVIFLYDRNHQLLCSSDGSLSSPDGGKAKDGELVNVNGSRFLHTSRKSSVFGWSYSIYYPASSVMDLGTYMTLTALMLLLVVLVISVISSWYVTVSLCRPIRIIQHLLENPEQGTMDYYRNYCEKYDELKVILTLIESSYFQTLAMSKELEQQNRRLHSAQNYALAAQMNPHFIFNTLDSINWKIVAMLKGNNDISPALADFSKIIRYALNKKGLVFLSEELDCSRTYIRLKNSLSTVKIPVSWDVDEELLDVKVPFLILQPLLENAFSYGAHTRKEEARIAVRCHREGNAMRLEVEDNGSGFPPEKLDEINRFLSGDVYYETSSHIGIINTHNRIRLTYGDEWGISIASGPARTVVAVRMPVNGEKDQT